MDTLRISLLGRLRILSGQDAVEIHLNPSVGVLLAYLVLKHGRTVPREKLVDLFWGETDPQHAHDCLNTALWRLRSTFRQYCSDSNRHAYLLTNNFGEVGFVNVKNCWLDIIEFETLWEQTCHHAHDLTQQDLLDLNQIAQLYEGDLLEGFDNDWVLPERERFRLIYLSCLARLMDYYHLNQMLEKSLEYAQRILVVDPLREDIHREVIRLYLELGQRAMAIHQYKTCCAILLRDLNIVPMLETRLLYEKVIADTGLKIQTKNAIPSLPFDTSEEYRNVLVQVENAVNKFEQARDDLSLAVEILHRYAAVHTISH
jgi:DNA-binding SARP family transcriptional activator